MECLGFLLSEVIRGEIIFENDLDEAHLPVFIPNGPLTRGLHLDGQLSQLN